MSRSIFGLFLVHCCISAGGLKPERGIDPQWVARAVAELQQVYDRYDSVSKTIEEEYEQIWQGDPKDPRSRKYENKTLQVSLSRLGPISRYEVTTVLENSSAPPVTRVDCNNEVYQFTLTKRDTDSPYVLIDFQPQLLPAGSMRAVGGAFHRFAFSELRHLRFAVGGQDTYVLHAMCWDDERKLVYARLSCQDNRNSPACEEEELWLDPANNWHVVEMKKRWKGGQVVMRTLTYGRSIGGLTFPEEMDSLILYPSKSSAPSCKTHTKLRKLAITSNSARDFSLSSYGLPEPVGIAPDRRVPNYVWLLIVAVSCGLLAFVIWRIGRPWRDSARVA